MPATAVGTQCERAARRLCHALCPSRGTRQRDVHTTPRVGGHARGVWCPHAARHRRSKAGARQAVRSVRGVPSPEGERLPTALGASRPSTQGVGGLSPSGRAPGWEGQRVAWGGLRQSAVPSGPPRPGALAVPLPGRATRPAPEVCRVARTAVRRWSRPPGSWWRAQTSPHRGVVVLRPGCAAHGDRAPGGLVPPGRPAWVRGTQGPDPEPVRRPRSARQADGGPLQGRGVMPMRPLTTHWSRRHQPPLVPRCGCWRGSPRALGCLRQGTPYTRLIRRNV